MKKQKFKNGDKVVFTESPFAFGTPDNFLDGTPIEIVDLDGNYFNFSIPAYPNDPVFTAHINWVKKYEE